MDLKWFRVLYGPVGGKLSGMMEYGWTFPSPTMGHAWDTLRRVCADWRERPYRIAEVLPDDVDHPDQNTE